MRLGPYIYDAVKERLLDGAWKAGEFIPIEVLKAEFATSKQPVMEAMRRLAGDGLIDIIPQVGCRVPTYAVEEVADFFTVFSSLEAETTAVATHRRADDQITQLEIINARIGTLADVDAPADKVHQYRSLNRAFHQVILEMTNSAILMRTSSRMWDMSDILINASEADLPLANDVAARHAEHAHIIEAIRAFDSERAREQMRKHILRNIPMLESPRTP